MRTSPRSNPGSRRPPPSNSRTRPKLDQPTRRRPSMTLAGGSGRGPRECRFGDSPDRALENVVSKPGYARTERHLAPPRSARQTPLGSARWRVPYDPTIYLGAAAYYRSGYTLVIDPAFWWQ